MAWLLPLIPAVPAASALLLVLFGRRYSRRAASVQASAAVLASFGLSTALCLSLIRLGPGAPALTQTLFPWIQSGAVRTSFALRFDALTAVMTLVVTGVGFLIHVYSAGYMGRDRSYARYFAHLNLFAFAMLLLVMSSDLLLMFVGWEGVGLCSYLLIGFWYDRPAAARAGQKAFLVNRVGDAAFIVGILVLLAAAGTTDLAALDRTLLRGNLAPGLATAVALLLFAGACGKSAQIPLFVWLPDAMEGPTPVSALIHAATMVTAGVYLVCRLNVLFSASAALDVVGWVGAATALVAATMACVQNDIKKVLAYSTISQIGYMFIGCGAGAYAAGMFHLVTHAFFKSLLFLAAGSVIHALSGEQDLRRMGGLRPLLPRTYPAFLIGALAMAGVPVLSGFFSKDAILSRAFTQGRTEWWIMGIATAVLTAFYAFRLVFRTFFGPERLTAESKARLHESPPVMTVPLSVLAVLAAAAGFIGLPAVFGRGVDVFGAFLGPVFGATGETGAAHFGTEWLLMLASATAALGGIGLAYVFYLRRPGLPEELVRRLPGPYRVARRGWFVDEAYDRMIVTPLVRGSEAVYSGFDLKVIDGAVKGLAASASSLGKALNRGQTGRLKDYALVLLAGLVIVIGLLVW